MSNYPTGSVLVILDGIELSLKKLLYDEFGVSFALTEIPKGWYDPPPTTRTINQLPYGDGGALNNSWLAARPITLIGEIWAHDWTSLEAAMLRLHNALPLNRVADITFIESDGSTLTAKVTAEGNQVIIPIGHADKVAAQFSLQVVAPDPRKYGGLVERTVSAVAI